MFTSAASLVAAALVVSEIVTNLPNQAAKTMFEQGQKVVEDNCGDCYPRSDDRLAEGASLIQESIALGYANRAQAYRILSDVYGLLSLGLRAKDPQGSARYRAKLLEVNRALYQASPTDPEAILRYSGGLPEGPERVALLEVARKLDPRNPSVLWSLGWNLIRLHRFREATNVWSNAIDIDCESVDATYCASSMLEARERLREAGCSVIGLEPEKASSATPKKKEFLEALKHVDCPKVE